MQTYADNDQENQSQTIAHEPSHPQNSNGILSRYTDNRLKAVAQRKMQEMAGKSPKTREAVQLQALANRHSAAKTIQRKSQIPTKSAGENQTGLPAPLKAGIETLSGYAMDDVKVHYNSPKPAQLQAHAYAQGTDIHMAPGQEKHLPHEAWHVVQQKQGRVKPTMQMKGKVGVNDEINLEKEADVMGARAARAHAYRDAAPLKPGIPLAGNVLQGKWFRMSTLLNDQDIAEVSYINQLASARRFMEAFGEIVKKYDEPLESFKKILYLGSRESEVFNTIHNVLWETFEDPDKAYTVGEVLELLEDNETVSEASARLYEENESMMSELIQQFNSIQISVPFRSDVDQGQEAHYIAWDKSDIIIASNPKPLKAVLTQGSWEGFPLAGAVLTQLEALRKAAKMALYKIAGNAKRNITGSRTKTNMNNFRKALENIADVFKNLGGTTHKATLMPATDLSTSVGYGNNNYPTEGKHVIARPLSINSSTGGSQPVDGRLMTSIRTRAGNQSKSYVQMHLLNDLVFGPGELWNLTPGPKQSNVDMENRVEDPLKRAVLGKGLVINFEASVNYNYDPTAASNKEIQQNPDKYRFQSIDFTAEQLEYDQTSKAWSPASAQDADVQQVDGARINWRYGSLTPLTPKPRILASTTTVQELMAVNIQKAAAQRIVAFVKANKTWTPQGADKQQQLADAVKAWDKKSRIPNISSWKSTAVLWT